MRKSLLMLLVVAVYLIYVPATADAKTIVTKIDANLVRVTVTGVGMDKDEATRDAMRKAVEAGAGTYIYSQSKVRDFALIRDTILTRSAGFLQSKKVISAKQLEDQTWEVRLQAVVSIKGIVDVWGVVKNLLQQMGRPKIMVAVTEKINTAVQQDSTVQTRIEGILLKSGFLLVDKKQLKAIEVKDLQAAVAEDKPDKIQAIAKRYGAQLFIVGSATATGKPVTIMGIAGYRYGADTNIRCFRSDTAQLLSSRTSRVMTSQRADRVAASKALSGLGGAIAPVIRDDVLRFWQDALEGRGEVQLIVDGLASFTNYVKLKKALGELKAAKNVNGNFHNKVGKFSIESDLNADKLGEKLVEAMEGTLEISDVSQNVIKATYKGK